MRYLIKKSDEILGEAKNKQELYSVWEDLYKSLRKKGTFNWSAGFVMAEYDNIEIRVEDIHGRVPKYNRNEWKNR